jgi:dipeptidyl aminopeptidase/acylaminoacyl peptidase
MLCLLYAGVCLGQGSNDLIVEKRPIEPPVFEANCEIARYATPAEYDEAKTDHSFIYERVLYRSDGAIVSGFLYFPKTQRGRLPAIIYSRGSMVVNNQAPVLLTMIRRLALEGFVVFAPMFRGSDGTKGHEELGGVDLDDLKAAIDVVKSLPIVDADNVFLYGESRGGMMTYFALRENWPGRRCGRRGRHHRLSGLLESDRPGIEIGEVHMAFL